MMNKLKSLLFWIKSGSPWIWLTGGAVSISMLSVLGLMLLIGWKGLTYFWPAPLYQWQVDSKDLSLVVDLDETVSKQDVLIGQLYERKYIPIEQVPQAHDLLSPQNLSTGLIQRLSIKVCEQRALPSRFCFNFGC